MGILYQYHTGAWEARARGGGASGGGTTFDTNFSIKMSAALDIVNTTTTKIDTFDTIVVDANSEWNVANKYWVCADTGTYVISANIVWESNTTGYRIIYIYVDGVSVQARNMAPINGGTTHNYIVDKRDLTAGQYVEIYGRQSSGGNLEAQVGSPATEWQIWRVK